MLNDVKRMVSRWALDQLSNTVWTIQWRYIGEGLQCCVHTNAHTQVYNAVCTPTPIHRLCTQTFSPPQKTNVLLGIEPAAPPPSQSPSRNVNPLHQSTCNQLYNVTFGLRLCDRGIISRCSAAAAATIRPCKQSTICSRLLGPSRSQRVVTQLGQCRRVVVWPIEKYQDA